MNETSNPLGSRRRPWSRRRELMRPVDWVEAVLLLVVIIAALVLVPVALTVGSETYADQNRAGQEQSRMRDPATATLVQDAPLTFSGAEGVPLTPEAPARWTLPNGTERAGIVPVDSGAEAGSQVPVWLDEAGYPVREPVTREQAALAGVAVAMGFWITAAASLFVFFLLAHAGLNRSRYAAWQRDWARVEPDWTRTG